jgi:hypothetical protein
MANAGTQTGTSQDGTQTGAAGANAPPAAGAGGAAGGAAGGQPGAGAGASGAGGAGAAGGAAGAGTTTASTTARVLADDDEPQPGEQIVLTTNALNKRIERATRTRIKELAGTDDPKTIKERLELATRLEAAETERAKAAMTETERAKADMAAANARAEAAELRAMELEEQQVVATTTQEIRSIADEHIKGKFFKLASADLADHLADVYTEAQLTAMTDKDKEKVVRDFFAQYAKDNPELAKGTDTAAAGGVGGGAGAAAGAGAGGGTPPARAPLTNGTANPKGRGTHAKPPPNVFTTGPWQGKTLAPGHPNSMTKQEVEQWKRATGNNY